ncbi:unnamed protein product [Gongylonema pulchrum]|uniref:COP9 signalosome complex subunit 4 n=2 Tax=Gongylonema pulchrum TaxID=637853 RepID=A0A183E4S4_9BILA|nr:unnamed protein product [Gongylonema pulchrum]
MVVSRQFISDIIVALDNLDRNLVLQIARGLLNIVQSHMISYEEQVTALRFRLADVYEEQGNFEEAAKNLIAIPLETGQRGGNVTALRFRLADVYEEQGNFEEAAKNLIAIPLETGQSDEKRWFGVEDQVFDSSNWANSPINRWFFPLTLYARVLDHRNKFIEAAQRYYDLSIFQTGLSNAEKMQALTNAISCAILASPAHQRCTREGWSVLKRAIVEHNFIAVSRIFTNITFEQLAKLLDIDNKQAEKMAWQMIADKRVSGMMDQIDGLIHFTPSVNDDAITGREALAEWDQLIGELCHHVNTISDMIELKHPLWCETLKQISNCA